MGKKLVGLDIGTTTISALLLDAAAGDVLDVITLMNNASLKGAADWEALQDPNGILDQVGQILDALLAKHRGVAGIGITGQMHGILYVDDHGQALSPLMTWQDGRGNLPDGNGVTCAMRLAAATGRQMATGMGSVTHLYNVHHDLVPPGAASFCTIMDFVAMRLVGRRRPLVDATNAAGLGAFDLEKLRFATGVFEGLGLDPRLLPEVRTDYPALGETRAGCPVFVSLGDNQASFLGSVGDIDRAVLVNVGTSGQVSVFQPDYLQYAGLDTRPFPYGGYLAVGASLCGGRAYAQLWRFLSGVLRLFTGEQRLEADWDIMNAVDPAKLAGEPLIAATRFAGTRLDPTIRGALTSIGLDNFTPEHLIAAVRSGIVSELVDFYEELPVEVRSAKSLLVGSGNGLRLNAALRTAFEKRLGLKMVVPNFQEEASFGAALLAGTASGIFNNLGEGSALLSFTKAALKEK